MTRISHIFIAAVALGISLGVPAGQAKAACIAEYKAKRDNPLELYYDVAQIPGPCTQANATAQLQAMLAAQGLTLLKVLSVSES